MGRCGEEVRHLLGSIVYCRREETSVFSEGLCPSFVEFLEEVSSRTQSNEVSARRMDEATKGLLSEAEGLREDVHRFQI